MLKAAYEEKTLLEPDSQTASSSAGPTLRLSDRLADESYKLFTTMHVPDPTPEESRQICNKCRWRLLPFLCIGYHLMYVDKHTVCYLYPNSRLEIPNIRYGCHSIVRKFSFIGYS